MARNGTPLFVRRITELDVGDLQRFNTNLSTPTRNLFLPHAYDDATLRRVLERDARGQDRTYVLRAGAEVVGYFFLWEFDQPVPVLGVGLADAWQGQGLGEPLLHRLIEEARTAGCEAVELTTVLTNERAFRLYARVGFQSVGVVENIAGDGRVVRERQMFLPLRQDAVPKARSFKPPA